jgi:hypothetical protein
MKKRLNETVVANELKGGSLFFANRPEANSKEAKTSANTRTAERVNGRTPEQANARTGEHPNARTDEQANTRTGERPNERTGERPNAPTKSSKPTKRAIIRHSFQFYQDQLTQLKRLRAQKELQGEACHLSDLVRQALDEFLARNSEPSAH